jgi:hypothetical protein
MLKPKNIQLESRLEGIFKYLWNSFETGNQMSGATKGTERELFIKGFLSQVFPSHYRFSSGDVTDSHNHRSGQVDIVLEYPQSFSFPFYPDGPRLFLAENVAAIIEVKSNIANQWDQVEEKAQKVRQIERIYSEQFYKSLLEKIQSINDFPVPDEIIQEIVNRSKITNPANTRIPLIAVGFEGWKNLEAAQQKFRTGSIDAIFVIESRYFISNRATTGSSLYSLLLFLEFIEEEIKRNAVLIPTLTNYRLD